MDTCIDVPTGTLAGAIELAASPVQHWLARGPCAACPFPDSSTPKVTLLSVFVVVFGVGDCSGISFVDWSMTEAALDDGTVPARDDCETDEWTEATAIMDIIIDYRRSGPFSFSF